MIRITSEEPTNSQWQAWKNAGDAERDALINDVAAGRQRPIVERLYKQRKTDIFAMYHGKCAYCETLINETDQPGDLDHYRPKGRVCDEDGNQVQVSGPDGRMENHPGYYWLTYDWRNLLPSCWLCNRPTKRPSGQLTGKWDKFPVRDYRASQPGDEDQEEPLLLHPLLQNPEKHFKIDDSGVLTGTTKEGETCIRILGLNRDGLIESRLSTYWNADDKFSAYINAIRNQAESRLARLTKQLEDYRSGRSPYSLAARTSLDKSYREFTQVFDPTLFATNRD